jgi:O-antigen/teichoic acid export membrane protein
MKQNMGSGDRTIRVFLTIVIAILLLTHVLKGTLAIVLGILAVIFLATSLFGVCPLYIPFKISTLKKKS